MNENYDGLKRVSDELGVEYHPQDWGIINGDANRFLEFHYFFESHPNLEKGVRYQLFELVVSSFNEAILDEVADSDSENVFSEWIGNYSNVEFFSGIYAYWKSIANNDEFPVGTLM